MSLFLLLFEEQLEDEDDPENILIVRTPVVVPADCGEDAAEIGCQVATLIGVPLSEVHPIKFRRPEPEPTRVALEVGGTGPIESDLVRELKALSTEALRKRLEHGRNVLPKMVGNLYPSILSIEIGEIEKILAERSEPEGGRSGRA